MLGDESTAGKLVDESLVDRRALELEVVEVFDGAPIPRQLIVELPAK
jgi:hypothetical protein